MNYRRHLVPRMLQGRAGRVIFGQRNCCGAGSHILSEPDVCARNAPSSRAKRNRRLASMARNHSDLLAERRCGAHSPSSSPADVTRT
jgi:hypothetical protein